MDYGRFFRRRLDALHAEGRYRVFADLERRSGRFPRAYDHRIGAEVTVWCSTGTTIARAARALRLAPREEHRCAATNRHS